MTTALRDKAAVTRLLLLARLRSHPGTSLAAVAHELGVTAQAMSLHARRLADQGALEHDGRHYRPTAKGLQHLHEGIRNLRDAVDDLAAPVADIEVTSAVAIEEIRAGEEVGLSMDGGDLAARPASGQQSRGRARHDASIGQEVLVEGLTGIVELAPGKLTLITVPSPVEGGVRCVALGPLRALLDGRPDPQIRAAHGTGARILARALHGDVALEFAADHAAFNAAERGLDVHLYVCRDRLADAIAALERLNAATLRRVAIERLDAPEVRVPPQ